MTKRLVVYSTNASVNELPVYSDDGLTFTTMSNGSSAVDSMAFGAALFAGVFPGTSTPLLETSTTGTSSGASLLLPYTAYWQSIIFAGSRFIAVASSTLAGYSATGTSWTGTTLPSNQAWVALSANSSTVVCFGYSSSSFAYSSDWGSTWTGGSMPSSQLWRYSAYGVGTFVCLVSGSAIAAYSTTGTSWTQITTPISNPGALAFGNGTFVAVPSGSATGMYSTNGTTWSTMTMPSSQTWAGVIWHPTLNKFIAVASGSTTVGYSSDGITWTSAANMPTTYQWGTMCIGDVATSQIVMVI